MIAKLSKKRIREDIMQEAKVLGLHSGAVAMFADRVADRVTIWAKRRSMVTTDDLNDRIARELKPYNEDLAYLFESRDKII